MDNLNHHQDLVARKHGYMTIGEAEAALKYGDKNDRILLADILLEAQENWAAENYPVRDDVWASRRWKADGSEYTDLSGYSF